jgi:L-amino acid N-acyltransferase YncA
MSRQMYVLRGLNAADWRDVQRIYLQGIESGQATFETEVPSWERWDAAHLTFARIVLTVEDKVQGWAALSKVSARQVYSGVAEVSVYVTPESQGHGFGRALLEALIRQSEANGVWTLQASIFPENEASITLHRRNGFREVGRRERIAKLHGIWRDTVLLERRSAVAGTDAKELRTS